DVELRDLARVYQLCHEIRSKYPAEKTESATTETKSNPVRIVTQAGSLVADKATLLMTGRMKSTEPFIIEDGHGNSLEYPSHSEADLALTTCLAIKYGNNPELIAAEFAKSSLCREKWLSREDYRTDTINKAILSAGTQPPKQVPIIQESAVNQTADIKTADDLSADTIPPFDPSVITGIYRKFVELITRGTTLAPQFAFLAAKVIVGARMAGRVHFESLDVEPRYYGAVIGESGS